jgi:putative pyruvate formate lyase activating enzyme
MEGVVDLYLPDLKFGPPGAHGNCGAELGGMPGYWDVVTGAIDVLHRSGKTLIVRHLLMPGHFDCCTRPVLGWLSQRPGITVSLLTQYVAPAHARGALAAPLDPTDIHQAHALASALNIKLTG